LESDGDKGKSSDMMGSDDDARMNRAAAPAFDGKSALTLSGPDAFRPRWHDPFSHALPPAWARL